MYSTVISIAGTAALVFAIMGVTGDSRNASAADREKIAQAQTTDNVGGTVAPNEEMIERGRYLANDVAMCVICHSPKDSSGRVIRNREFSGGAIPLNSPFRGAPWADNAPALPPLVQQRADDVFALLTTGIWPRSGEPAQAPMPPFRLSADDARAIIAYLKTLD